MLIYKYFLHFLHKGRRASLFSSSNEMRIMPSSQQENTTGQIRSLKQRIDWFDFMLLIGISISVLAVIIATGITTTWLVARYTQGYELNISLPMFACFVAPTLTTLTVFIACQRTALAAQLTRLQIVEDLKNQGT